MSRVQVLTPTGARHEAFRLCQLWMARQDHSGPIDWIVVDDGPEPSLIDYDVFDPERFESIRIVRPRNPWQPGMNTQSRNLLAGLELVDRDYPLVIFEDDDWYASDWLSTVSRCMGPAEVLGESDATYYNVRTGIMKRCGNKHHASLCATAVRGEGIERLVRKARDAYKFIDIELWHETAADRKVLLDGDRVVGMKGLPGRENIGVGKRLTGNQDQDGELLRRLVGSDAKHYLPFRRP